MCFKNEETDKFLKQHQGGHRFLINYLVDLDNNLGIFEIEVTLLKYPYKEFAWLFSCIIGIESTISVPINIIYAMNFTLHEKAIIGWGYLISSEVAFQLNNLKKT
jgi:hypothetical protein